MNGKTISVLIVDDHSVVRMGMAALLSAEADMQVVGNAKSRFAALPPTPGAFAVRCETQSPRECGAD